MDYIKLLNHFWYENRKERFTMAETTLYFYLLNEANRNYWQMPIACPTAIVCATTGMTKATLIRARGGLKKKRFISFTEGIQHSRAPTYEILTFETADDTACHTAHDTCGETVCTTIIENKETYKDNSSLNARKSIEELEQILIADVSWQKQIIMELNSKSITQPEQLIPYIHKFFTFLRICNVKVKEESDCRSHFFNKMRKEYVKPNNNIINSNNYDNKRIIEVPVTSPQAYEGSF